MVRKKVDDRVRTLIENSVKTHHRSLLVLVGDHGKDQVVNLHYILSRTQVKARPSVLWCYKKELGFSTHRKKRMRQIKRAVQRGLHDPEKDDPFDLFISSTNIRWCYYKDTHRILGQTFGMCVLQDFEAITPNLLARTVETVEGGGLVILLLRSVTSLKQLYTMAMDVHARFRTEAHNDVVARFNERFILSLGKCDNCLVLDDELNVLPVSQSSRALTPLPGPLDEGVLRSEDVALNEVLASVGDVQPVAGLVALARTADQAKAVLAFLEAVQAKTLKTTVSLTAARGRGKSAAVGLCLAGAIAYGYSNIFVTAPSPENLGTVFDFVKKGLEALKYTEHLDFEVTQAGHHSNQRGDGGGHGADARAVVRITVFRQHRQVIQYIAPYESEKLSQAELVAIDEAAAIPLPLVKRLLGPYLVFMSSTITGYEGTGRSLSLKLVQQLREQQGHSAAARKLKEVTLDTPIRYAAADPVEKWLNLVLCLDAKITAHRVGVAAPLPPAKDCQLYEIDRDTLFSLNKASEAFLQRVMALYTAAHYKNQPNDLQLLSDAPAHRLYVLLGPQKADSNDLPEVLCVLQVALEGRISQASVQASLARGHRASGDLIPWTISQQYQDSDFAKLSGARIVRIASHPDAQRMGYGSHAMELLIEHMGRGKLSGGGSVNGRDGLMEVGSSDEDEDEEDDADDAGKNGLLGERIAPRKELPPLLTPVSRAAGPGEALHWVGTSFGLTESLLHFWSRTGMKLVYLRQTANDLTGEHTAVMLRALDGREAEEGPAGDWLGAFAADALRRIVSLLAFEFKEMDTTLSLSIVDNIRSALVGIPAQPMKAKQLSYLLVPRDLQRLHLYARNLVDYHMILDLLPSLARVYFLRLLPETVRLSRLMEAILVGLGVRHRSVDALAKELSIEPEQLLAMFNKVIRKIGGSLQEIEEGAGGGADAERQKKGDAEVGGKVEKRKRPRSEESQIEVQAGEDAGPQAAAPPQKQHKGAEDVAAQGVDSTGQGVEPADRMNGKKKKKKSKEKAQADG